VFKHFPLSFHKDSLLAHQAALAAGEQGKFWEMHDLLFANQSHLKRDDLLRMSQQLDLDQQKFATDLDSGRFISTIGADQDEGTKLGVDGTPTFYINGKQLVGVASESEFKSAIERALGSQSTNTAGLLDFSEPNLEADIYARGSTTVPVTIVWFSDVQSALAPRAAKLVNQIMGVYGGQVRVILRHRPLESHPDAMLAHEAILAAGAQGKFWEMHDVILSHQNALKRDALITYAKMLGLNTEQFADDLQRQTYLPLIQSQLVEAQKYDVRGTPVFFVNKVRIDGLQSLESFSSVARGEIEKSRTAKRESPQMR